MKNASKTGRKRRDYIASWGETIVGLSRISDGRWRIIGTHIRFTEPDERKAVERFRKLDGTLLESTILGNEVKATRGELLELRDHVDVIIAANHRDFWQKAATEIMTRPQWVAQQTGIEKLAYLSSLKPPEPLPSPQDLRDLWEQHAACSKEEMKKVRKAWDHFVRIANLTSIGDITPQLVVRYRDSLHASGWTGKTQAYFIGGIRRVLTFAKGRAVAVDKITTVQGYLSPELLYPSESTRTLSRSERRTGRSCWRRRGGRIGQWSC